MKKLIIYGGLILVVGTAFATTFLETLKLAKVDAEEGIWNSFSYGAYGGPMSREWHNLAVPTRVALVKEIGAFVKAYTRSEDFAKRYAEYREGQKPSPPYPFVGVEQMKKEQKESLTKSIRETKETAKGLTGDVRKSVEEGIKVLEQSLKEIDNPNNPMFTREMNDMMRQGWDQENANHKKALVAWEKEYPVSPQSLIRQRLTYFLQLSSTVDFSAKLGKGPESTMVFLSPAYEQRGSDWKLLFRCGKESVDAARTVAQQWLAELK